MDRSGLLKELNRRTASLTDDQLKDILDKYKYEPRLEMFPDILSSNELLRYDYKTGRYNKIHSFEDFSPSTTPIAIIKDRVFILSEDDRQLYELKDKELNVMMNTYAPGISTNFIAKYGNDLIYITKGLEDIFKIYLLILEGENEGEDIKIGILSDDETGIYFIQGDYIIGTNIYKIQHTENDANIKINKVTSKKLIYAKFTGNLVFVKTLFSPQLYLYNLDSGKAEGLRFSVPNFTDITVLNNKYVYFGDQLAKFNPENETFETIDTFDDPIVDVISNSVFIAHKIILKDEKRKGKEEETYPLVKITNFLEAKQEIIEEGYYFNAKGVPVPKERINEIFKEFRNILPNNISKNIKDIILEFCRGDSIPQ